MNKIKELFSPLSSAGSKDILVQVNIAIKLSWVQRYTSTICVSAIVKSIEPKLVKPYLVKLARIIMIIPELE